MKVLIADDDSSKIRAASRVLIEQCGMSDRSVSGAMNAEEVKELLKKEHFDILLLDIIFPLNNLTDPEAKTSTSLIIEIESRADYKKPTRIIGFTAYDELSEEVIASFEKRSWNIIQYRADSDDWKESLKRAVDYSSRAAQSEQVNRYRTDICILTALRSPELNAVKQVPWHWKPEEPLDDITWYAPGKFSSGSKEVSVAAVTAPRMGLVASSLLAAKVISLLRPKFIVMTGICAGIEEKAGIGDVLVANPSWNWQSGKHKVTELGPQFNASPHDVPLPEFISSRVEQIASDKKAVAEIKSSFPSPPTKNELEVRCGPVASGSAVVADEDVLGRLLEVDRGMLGLEMEIYGVYAAAAAASHPRPTAVAFKSVCDFGTKEKNDAYQVYAAHTSARCMQLFFERFFVEIERYAGSI